VTNNALTSVVAALTASVCFGMAAILQSLGASRIARSHTVDVGLLFCLARSRPYVLGMGLDLLGFLAAVVAMRRLPVFAAEALIDSYLAVTAVLAVWLLGITLRSREWLALASVAAGVAILAWSAPVQANAMVGLPLRLSLLVTALMLGAIALAVDHGAARAGPGLAFIAGSVWGLIPLATRTIRDPGSVIGLLCDPAAFTVPAAGALGLLLYTRALQRTSVVTATAVAILGETLVPAAAGLTLLGDQPRPGTGAAALVGFLATIGGTLVLARYGDVGATSEGGQAASAGVLAIGVEQSAARPGWSRRARHRMTISDRRHEIDWLIPLIAMKEPTRAESRPRRRRHRYSASATAKIGLPDRLGPAATTRPR
jgi:drug/metabolite transporter (DMT)-like permease